ncbi:hypothetical protein D3C72_1664730 [compost metagenome]
MVARQHPVEIAVEHGYPFIKTDRGNRGTSIGADPRQGLQARRCLRKHPAMLSHHRLRTGMQVPRAGIIAQPGPFLEHAVERRRGQLKNGRPQAGEAQEVVLHRGDRGLLQHYFAQPDPIGIGPDTARPRRRRHAPGQVAGMAVIPGEHGRRIDGVRIDEGHGCGDSVLGLDWARA